ncbi:MAG: 50S ribosomal protein L29 [Candidatus Zambryskibacteria bacterium RIFCSPLOWO2_02_FULL_51_21]|uniref:Large ribosomal subunit protein uL29 n=1 Tax=Candidatus Zambryskibacteria bacterium RIFCSPHIGHO2_02_FULL_43_37 TaxID=1802749 RepID=A0A1G2TGK2_9BACT|nr:MAG: 50S ribosomal protein L29 [Candidatus Zambryskibacteria bacterium RIFCSPHIGHO2_01_FULL_52_18]OHA96417.1 MAG: 50S ribosomal protein L29 [Candidatus Zambryskibacteria bacterium RIFCSPHIGHO2_02_FULL_43_37]OHB07371.1 MAG: 50S ribosomal protein L29 [Candidatus Zambryskibacteria bacterium RIFCSPLOWO2_01_FULL_52_12]OHB11323.1 MAG: 50S ribosomal protein L29 [Candidatus Zambryskibacteria bacterium RIFCSPLOWO2_02_FULL_51_21]
MKKTTYKGKPKTDLVKALYEQREILSKFRFGAAGSKTRNVKEGQAARKEIARIMTELNANK